MSNNYSGRGGGYQQKRGGGGQHYQPRGGAGHTKQQDSQGGTSGSSQYVKKPKQQQETQEQQQQQQQQNQGNQPDLDSLTAEQKFNLLLSGGGLDALTGVMGGAQQQPVAQPTEEVKQQPAKTVVKSNTNRKRYAKDELISKFEKHEEVNFQRFEKDVLKWVEIFSSGSQEPENLVATDKENDMAQLQTQSRSGPGRFTKPGGQPWRGGASRPPFGALEEDENEEDPEWIDFDPKKESSSFFGRAIQNEDEIRENIKKEKERQLQAWGGRKRRDTEEDEFEKLIREEKEEARKRAAQMDKELSSKAEALASDLEHNERNFSDIDLIYEKNAKKRDTHTLDDDQLEDLFNTLLEEEQKKSEQPKPAPQQKPQPAQVNENIQQVQLTQNLQQQIKELTIQQKLQLQQQKIISTSRPKFTALQNIQNLFTNLPVVTHEKHRIKMDEIADMEPEQNQGDLFKQLMASINPFSKFIIEESQQQGEEEEAAWMLEPSIFSKPPDQIKEENLKKTSSEMFVIYKFFSDPLIKVKSTQHTQDEYVEIKELFPEHNLLQTNPLDVKLAVQKQMMQQQQQRMMMMQQQQMGMPGMQPPIPGPTPQFQTTSQEFIPSKHHHHTALHTDQSQVPSQQAKVQSQPEESHQPEGSGLSDIESQLKSLLGFNPR